MVKPWKPTAAQIAAAVTKKLPDILAPDLDVVFCGINPGLYSAAIGCHFGRPGNRFWPALFASGFTDRLLTPFDQKELLRYRCGITNLAPRASATAAEVTDRELQAGARTLARKVQRFRPRLAAFLGITAYRTAFARPRARLGPQTEPLAGAGIWVLPNPSGLNAHFRLADLADLFRALHLAVTRMKTEADHG
jgi:TDG/mug DNA glycosylase family protein